MQSADSDNAKEGKSSLYLVKDRHPVGEVPGGPGPIDIVAVHGLNGHCINSWTHAKTGNYWLRDLLPVKLPHARIMTFQYDSKVLGNENAYGVDDIANQLLRALVQHRSDCKDYPIVFVAHSLGGIVTKRVLTKAREDAMESTRNISENTKGIVFFGTPHRGSNSADWAAAISKIESTVLLNKESKLASMLKLHSPKLLEISQEFRRWASQYAIVTFYEQNIHPISRSLIVDKMSAILGLVHEDVLMLGGDHSSMCKFVDGDPRFDTVWWYIKRAAEGPAALRREGRRTKRERERKARKERESAKARSGVDGVIL